uniref:Uncharacterized protein n=1 Tax=Anopheles minimus TaxID=112268 RepID=A0A182WQ17_9DIPT
MNHFTHSFGIHMNHLTAAKTNNIYPRLTFVVCVVMECRMKVLSFWHHFISLCNIFLTVKFSTHPQIEPAFCLSHARSTRILMCVCLVFSSKKVKTYKMSALLYF